MTEKKLKTWQCWKCGFVGKSYSKPLVCVQPMAFRTSGICGGGLS